MLERALALGYREPSALLRLARLQVANNDETAGRETLDLVEDDPDDPALAIERDHIAANSKTFSDPEWALPRLRAVAERWGSEGNTEKFAWRVPNAGVEACFSLGLMDEAAAELQAAHDIFEAAGDKLGIIGTASFMTLVKPTDRRVPALAR